MKTLIFLLMGIFCFAHGQTTPKQDSALAEIKNIIIETKNINKESKILIEQKEAQKITESSAKRKAVKTYKKKDDVLAKSEAVKPENETKPIMEIPIKVYPEYVRGSFFYRLFHKEDFKIKYYKIVDNEKVYLN